MKTTEYILKFYNGSDWITRVYFNTKEAAVTYAMFSLENGDFGQDIQSNYKIVERIIETTTKEKTAVYPFAEFK